MINFEYGRPTGLLETVSILRNNPDAILFAGGTDVLVRIKQRTIRPTILIDLKDIAELRGISPIGDRGLRIGAMTTLTELVEDDLVRERCPVLSRGVASMACVQVRNRATVGGNLANASPSADTAPPLIVLDAQLEIFTDGQVRTVNISDFFTGPGETVLSREEILVVITIPDVKRKAHYIKHTLRKAMDIAGVSVCLSKQENGNPDPRLVLGAVAPTPIRIPEAELLLAEGKIKEAAEVAANAARPIDDVRASADYRREIIAPLVQRAYREVFET